MSHWITLQPDFGIDCQTQMTLINLIYLQPSIESDEMLEDIKAIAELEPNGVVSHSYFFVLHKL